MAECAVKYGVGCEEPVCLLQARVVLKPSARHAKRHWHAVAPLEEAHHRAPRYLVHVPHQYQVVCLGVQAI